MPPPRTDVGDGPDSANVPVMLARLEGKVDVALAQQGATIANHDREIADHETRLRSVEGRSTVSWKQLWGAVCSAAGLIALASPFIERLYSLHP